MRGMSPVVAETGNPCSKTRRSDPRTWKDSELSEWLASRGLPSEISNAFEIHLVNGLLAEDLSIDDLAAMGIMGHLHQKRVLLELRNLFSNGRQTSNTLRRDLSYIASSTASTIQGQPAPVCPAAPQPQRSRPRPHSARLVLNSSATRLRLEQETQKAKLFQSLVEQNSPYSAAIPRKTRPRSASSAHRAAREELGGLSTSSRGRHLLDSSLPLRTRCTSVDPVSPTSAVHAVGQEYTQPTRAESIEGDEHVSVAPLSPLVTSAELLSTPLPPVARSYLPPTPSLSSTAPSPREPNSQASRRKPSQSEVDARVGSPPRSRHGDGHDMLSQASAHRSSHGQLGTTEVEPKLQHPSELSDKMSILALGGHASVSELLHDRDSLAVALAAEKRRSAEFEQLWRRSQAEADRRQQASPEKDKELWRAEHAEYVINLEMASPRATSADLLRTINSQMRLGSLTDSNGVVQQAKLKAEALRIAEAEEAIITKMNAHQLTSADLRRTIEEQKAKGCLEDCNATVQQAEAKFEALQKAEVAKRNESIEVVQSALAAEKSRSLEFEQLWRKTQVELDRLQQAVAAQKEHVKSSEANQHARALEAEMRRSSQLEQMWRQAQSQLDELKQLTASAKDQRQIYEEKQTPWSETNSQIVATPWSETNSQIVALLRERYKQFQGSRECSDDKYCENKYVITSTRLLPEPAAEPTLQEDLVEPSITTPRKVDSAVDTTVMDRMPSSGDFKLKAQDMVITTAGPPFLVS